LRRRVRQAVGGLLGGLAIAVGPTQAGAEAGCTRVLGPAVTTPAQLAGWFATTGHQPRLDVSVLDLATMFVEEGAREGVRGDLAFAQAIVETGYFGFSTSVVPELHNYAGIGATGGGVKGSAFPDARVGVRAQVQHLRAYADPSLRSAADLKAPLVDPRFALVVPNPRAVACWEQFGNGVWAADPTGYGPRVLSVHQRISGFPAPVPVAPSTTAPTPAVTPAPEPFARTGADPPPAEAEPVAPDVAAQGGAVARSAAYVLVGFCLLSLVTTLWWHGRRFARSN